MRTAVKRPEYTKVTWPFNSRIASRMRMGGDNDSVSIVNVPHLFVVNVKIRKQASRGIR